MRDQFLNTMDFEHISVLLSETIDSLNIKPEGTYVDGTLGGAGHSLEICRHLNGNGRLIGFDQDEDAIAAASARLEGFNDRVTVIRSNFCSMAEELTKRGIHKADGILLDLGVSSHQLDEAERGFSYRFDAPLDMRMDRSGGRTAADVVNTYDEERLFHVIKEYLNTGEVNGYQKTGKSADLQAERKQADRNHRGIGRDHKGLNTCKSKDERRTSRKEDISGDKDRSQCRT